MYKVWRCLFNVNSLQAVAFLNASGKTVNVKSEKVNKRPSGLTFFWFIYKIDSVDIDPHIFQNKPTFS